MPRKKPAEKSGPHNGFHYLCLKCQRVTRFFKTKADVKRHLQEQHSGIQFQCGICGYLFHRRNISHSCNATEQDMEYVDPITGIYGEEAQRKLRKFINEEQNNYWRYVATMDELDLPESPFPGVRSVVVRVNPPRQPRPRKRRDRTPESLGSPESIVLEEPPNKKQQLDELLQDLECTPSLSSSSSSSSSPSSLSSEEDSDIGIVSGKITKSDKHNKKSVKQVDKDRPKELKAVADKTKKTESDKNKDVGKKMVKEVAVIKKTMDSDKKRENREKETELVKQNAKRRETGVENSVRKEEEKQKDNMKEKRCSLSKEREKRKEKEKEADSDLSLWKEKDKQKETVKARTNNKEREEVKRKETETKRSKGIETVKVNNDVKGTEIEQESANKTDCEQIVNKVETNKTVKENEGAENGVTEKIIRKESNSSKEVINVMESGEVEEESVINNSREINNKEVSDRNMEQGSEKDAKNETEKRTESGIEETVNEKENEMEKEIEVVKEGVIVIGTQEVESVENIEKVKETGTTEKDDEEKKDKNKDGIENNVCEKNAEENIEINDINETNIRDERNDKVVEEMSQTMSDKRIDTQNTNMDKTKVDGKYEEQVKFDIQSERRNGTKDIKQTEKRENKRNVNETESHKDKKDEQKGQKDISKSNKVQGKINKPKVRELKEKDNKQPNIVTKEKQTQSKQTQNKRDVDKDNKAKKVLSDKNSNINNDKNVKEVQPVTGKENKVPESDAKKKVTIKEYQARKLEENRSAQILENIMCEMTNTYANINVLSPIQDMQTSSYIETINAVASITHDTVEETYDKAADVVSEHAMDVLHEVIMQDMDRMLDQEIDIYVNEQAQKDIEEIKGNRKETSQRRTADKRKNAEAEVNIIGTKRKFYNNMENLDSESEIEQDEDLKFIAKIQGNKVILNIGGARFETSFPTLQKDPESLLSKLFTSDSPIIPQGNSVFIDRNPSHFKVILNYLRCDMDINPAILPKERKHLLELKKECEYFRVKGLRKIVKRRLKLTTELYGMD